MRTADLSEIDSVDFIELQPRERIDWWSGFSGWDAAGDQGYTPGPGVWAPAQSAKASSLEDKMRDKGIPFKAEVLRIIKKLGITTKREHSTMAQESTVPIHKSAFDFVRSEMALYELERDAVHRIIGLVQANPNYFGATLGQSCIRAAAAKLEQLIKEAR